MITFLNMLNSSKNLRYLNKYFFKRYKSTNRQNISLSDATRSKFTIGKTISGFSVDEIQDIPELHLTAIRLHHLGTNAQYLHIARDDSNNVFCIGFRTVPMDNTGVPHILEHNVLCGSRKYPCRDPFFKMLNRSLSTFMNALTGSDCTFYPFSTQNPTDFKNLLSVYLDAALYPNLKKLDFMQEGWRLELANLEDESSQLVFKGVVFNEMKGVFADPQQIFMRQLQSSLLPSHTYSFESGGDPLHIPELTWEQMREFHINHYHPTNSFMFSYGNQPLEDHLSYINDNYLRHFVKEIINTTIPQEKRWDSNRSKHITCGIDALASSEEQSSIAVSFMLTDIKDEWENFVLSLMCELLVSGPNAPFYKSLLEPQLGSSFTPGTGFDGQTRSCSFTVGVQGANLSNTNKIVTSIQDTFKQVYKEGFSRKRVESILHKIELSMKHQTSDFGLTLLMALVPLLNLGVDPINSLKINQNINKFRSLLNEDPEYLQQQIKKHFLTNPHKLTLSMSPDSAFEEKRKKSEDLLLQEKVSKLSDSDHLYIVNMCQELKKNQEKKQDSSCLPTLRIPDIPRTMPVPQLQKLTLNGQTPCQLCEQPTNGVSYFNAILDTQHLPERLHVLVPLFCGIMTQMGAGKLDFCAFQEAADLVSGGLSANVHIAKHPINAQEYEQGIVLSSHSLDKNWSSMLDLWKRIFTEIKFNDEARFATLIKMMAKDSANTLIHSGHSYAMSSAASSISYTSHVSECWEGLTFLQSLKQLSELPSYSSVLADLKELSSLLFNKQNLRIAVHTSPAYSEHTIKEINGFLDGIDGVSNGVLSLARIPQTFTPHSHYAHHVFPFPVNFAAKSFPCVPYGHKDSGSLKVLARVMFQFLHREIREKGGAYGGGAILNCGSAFQFYSYRDPNSIQTLKTFDAAVDWVLEGNFSNEDLTGAKLGIFQKIDAPIPPGSKGLLEFLHHISGKHLNAHRRSILDSTSKDIIEAAQKYLKEAITEGACVIGPENDVIDKDPKWKSFVHRN